MNKIRCLKFGPETFDGHSHWILHPRDMTPEQCMGLLNSLDAFRTESDVGDTFECEVIEMTDEEYERMPDTS